MKEEEKLSKINETLKYFIENNETPTIKKISEHMNMTSQNFYLSWGKHVDYVNSCIATIQFNQLAEKVKTINKDYTLIEIIKSKNVSYRLVLQCSNPNHEPFQAMLRNFKCKQCHLLEVQEKGLAIAHEIAKSHGGQCLSTEYKNQLSKITFKCSNPNHPAWTTTFLNVLYKKTWCRHCSGEAIKPEKERKNTKGAI